MERKESANGLQLVKLGAIRLKGHFSTLFMGTFAMVMPLILVLLVPAIMAILFENFWIFSIGLVVFVVCVGPMQIGYIKFFNEVIDGNQPRISLIYSQFKFNVFTLRIVYATTLLFLMYILGGILWIITAGFVIAFFSMILFFFEKYKYPRFSSAFKDCAKQMVGNRLALFSYKLIFYFVYLLLFIVGALCMCLVYILAMDSLLISWLIAVCSSIIFIFMFAMITLYFHSCNQIFFEDALMYNERKRTRIKKVEVKSSEKNEDKSSKSAESTKATKETDEISSDTKKSESSEVITKEVKLDKKTNVSSESNNEKSTTTKKN